MDGQRDALARAEELAKRPPPATGLPPIARWAMDLFKDVGLEDAIRADYRTAGTHDARLSNLRDLAGTIARYERRRWSELGTGVDRGDLALTAEDAPADPDAEEWRAPTLAEALSRLALADMDDEEDDAEAQDAVTLMTLHSAKGLEFDDVFLVGLEEGILPHARSIEGDDAALAEERRLLYVGITRARHRLTLSLCRRRRRGGDAVEVLPSRYLKDIPEELLNPKTAERMLSPEESADLRRDFFKNMKAMLEESA